MRKPKQPKFLIKANDPFMEVEVLVYRGQGVQILRRLRKLHIDQCKLMAGSVLDYGNPRLSVEIVNLRMV